MSECEGGDGLVIYSCGFIDCFQVKKQIILFSSIRSLYGWFLRQAFVPNILICFGGDTKRVNWGVFSFNISEV